MVGLGALGIVVELTLAVEPAYTMAQRVYEGLGWDVLLANLDAITAAGDSVSVFHRAGPATEQVWIKRRLPADPHPADLFGSRPALVPRNPVLGADPVNATEQLAVAGPWSERLPHFRSGFTPSSGEDPVRAVGRPRSRRRRDRGDARPVGSDPAADARRRAAHRRRGSAVASPAYERDTLALHFTWRREPGALQAAVAALRRR